MKNPSRIRLLCTSLVFVFIAGGAVTLAYVRRSSLVQDDQSDLSLRNSRYPETYISFINIDLTSPIHAVSLTWAGKDAAQMQVGPFHSSPGRGLGNNDCNDCDESNRLESQCTPKGRFTVDGISDALAANPDAVFVTWIDMQRAVGLHFYPNVPNYPASSGCVRLSDRKAAQLIHDNCIVGKTIVAIDGKWSRPVDRAKLRAQLVEVEGKLWSVEKGSADKAIVGIGFDLKAPDAKSRIAALGVDYDKVLSGDLDLSDEQIQKLLDEDIDRSIANCQLLFPSFNQLSDVRQRVVLNMVFDIGFYETQRLEQLHRAIAEKDYTRAAKEMAMSAWHSKSIEKATKLEEMMRTDGEIQLREKERPIIDAQMTSEEAFDGLSPNCPTALRNTMELITVTYYSFDGKLHQGQLVIDGELVEDVQTVFQIIRDTHFPIKSVIPISNGKFRKDGAWDDEKSMEADNTSAFNYRKTSRHGGLSQHALGRAIDFNPMQNPYVAQGVSHPTGAKFDAARPGTLSATHPIVQAFIDLGWQWGGFWTDEKDYQHFEKLH